MKAFVTCLASINYIGWTNIVFGCSGIFFSFFFGYLAKYTTRFPIVIFAITISIGIGLFVISWTPNPNRIMVLFYVYIAFSITQSIISGQLRGKLKNKDFNRFYKTIKLKEYMVLNSQKIMEHSVK